MWCQLVCDSFLFVSDRLTQLCACSRVPGFRKHLAMALCNLITAWSEVKRRRLLLFKPHLCGIDITCHWEAFFTSCGPLRPGAALRGDLVDAVKLLPASKKLDLVCHWALGFLAKSLLRLEVSWLSLNNSVSSCQILNHVYPEAPCSWDFRLPWKPHCGGGPVHKERYCVA